MLYGCILVYTDRLIMGGKAKFVMDKGVIIDKEMWIQLEEMFCYGTKEDTYLAVGILSECELESFDVVGCWYMKRIYDYVVTGWNVEVTDVGVHLFIARITQWLKETNNWQKMCQVEKRFGLSKNECYI
jgi:hypothetical protein